MDEVDPDKSAKLESARRFCDLMEEEEDISLAQSVAACRELAQWLETTTDEEIILTSLDCFSLLLERLNDQFRPLLSLTVGPLLTTLGQQGSKVRLAAITLLTNLVEVHTAREIFELSINGFYHEEFRIREGCCLFVLSVIKRLGANSGLTELVGDDSNTLPPPLITIATSDSAANARNAAAAAICELLKLAGSNKAREAFDQVEGSQEPWLKQKMDSAMAAVAAKIAANEKSSVESASGDWLDGTSRMSMDRDIFYAKIDTVRETLLDNQSDSEEKSRALRLLRSAMHSNPSYLNADLWGELSQFLHISLVDILKARKLTRLVREASLTIQHLCSISTSPNQLIDEPLPLLFALLHRAGDATNPGAEAVWGALKMSVRKFQHSKVIKHALKANPATNPALKEINVPSVRRRIMNLLEMMLTMWEDARPLRKMKGGIVEAIHRGVYDSDGETRQCARRAWHGLHGHFPTEAAELLRSLTTSQQNLILGKVAESRAPSRGGSRANSPGRSSRSKIGYSQPVSRSGSPGRRAKRAPVTSSRISSARSTRVSRDPSPSRRRPATGTRTTVSSRRTSPSRRATSAKNSPAPGQDKTVPVIKALTSMSINDKKAGLLGLKRLIAKQVPFRTPELKKILESLRGLLAGRGPLLLTALDVLTDLLNSCGAVLDYPWCNFLVPSLTNRAVDSSLPGQSLAAVFKARTAAIENLNPSLQLQALSKLIQEERDNQPRSKVQILVWLTQLATRLEGHELQMAEVRIAITRVVQWGGELTRSNKLGTKNGQMRKCAHEALLALQTSCPAEFEALLESLPPTTSETARYLLSTSQNASRLQSRNGSRIGSRVGSRVGSRAASPTRRPARKVIKEEQNGQVAQNGHHEPSSKSPVQNGNARSETPSTENTSEAARPPPSPQEPVSDDVNGDGDDPIGIFGDSTRASPDRLVALESLEPELLDVTEIGRALLALKGALLSEQSDDVIRKGALSSIGNFSETVSQHFQNFTAPLVVTVAKLSLNEEYEIPATECLEKMINNLPPITLVDPLCVMCSSKHDNTELKTIGLNSISLLPARFAKEVKTPTENGDAPSDISEMSFWSKLSATGIECAQSRLSSIRKLGCGLIASMASATNNNQAVEDILAELPDTAKRLASAHIRKLENI